MKVLDYLSLPSHNLSAKSSLAALEYTHGCLSSGSVLLANFVPKVLGVENQISPQADGVIYVKLCAIFSDSKTSNPIRIPLEKVTKIKFQAELAPQCFLESDDAQKLLVKLIQLQISQMDITTIYYAARLGYIHHNGRHAYIAGNTIIGSLDIPIAVDDDLRMSYPLDLNEKFSFSQQVNYCNRLIALSEPSAILFSYFILGLLRSLFEDAQVSINFILFLLGDFESFKTTLAKLVTCLYGRHSTMDRCLHNLSTSSACLNYFLDHESDMVTILDDFNKTESKTEKRSQEEKLFQLIRSAANNVGRGTMHSTLSIRGQLLCTGEYAFSTSSLVTRTIFLELNRKQIDTKELTRLQAYPEALSTFAHTFITWVLEDYDSVVHFIRESYLDFRKFRVDEKKYDHERLRGHAEILHIAYNIFFNFCTEHNISPNLPVEKFDAILNRVVQDQIKKFDLNQKMPANILAISYEQLYEWIAGENINNPVITIGHGRPGKNNHAIYDHRKKGFVYLRKAALDELAKICSTNARTLLEKMEENHLLHTSSNKNGTRSVSIGNQKFFQVDWDSFTEFMEESGVLTYDEYGTVHYEYYD